VGKNLTLGKPAAPDSHKRKKHTKKGLCDSLKRVSRFQDGIKALFFPASISIMK